MSEFCVNKKRNSINYSTKRKKCTPLSLITGTQTIFLKTKTNKISSNYIDISNKIKTNQYLQKNSILNRISKEKKTFMKIINKSNSNNNNKELIKSKFNTIDLKLNSISNYSNDFLYNKSAKTFINSLHTNENYDNSTYKTIFTNENLKKRNKTNIFSEKKINSNTILTIPQNNKYKNDFNIKFKKKGLFFNKKYNISLNIIDYNVRNKSNNTFNIYFNDKFHKNNKINYNKKVNNSNINYFKEKKEDIKKYKSYIKELQKEIKRKNKLKIIDNNDKKYIKNNIFKDKIKNGNNNKEKEKIKIKSFNISKSINKNYNKLLNNKPSRKEIKEKKNCVLINKNLNYKIQYKNNNTNEAEKNNSIKNQIIGKLIIKNISNKIMYKKVNNIGGNILRNQQMLKEPNNGINIKQTYELKNIEKNQSKKEVKQNIKTKLYELNNFQRNKDSFGDISENKLNDKKNIIEKNNKIPFIKPPLSKNPKNLNILSLIKENNKSFRDKSFQKFTPKGEDLNDIERILYSKDDQNEMIKENYFDNFDDLNNIVKKINFDEVNIELNNIFTSDKNNNCTYSEYDKKFNQRFINFLQLGSNNKKRNYSYGRSGSTKDNSSKKKDYSIFYIKE